MTDLDPPDPLDDLASAHLDGLTSEAEKGRIAADPELTARVDRLRAVRAAIRVPDGPPDLERREQAIAAALAVAVSSAPGSTTSLHEARARRQRLARRTQLVAVAAAVAVAALLVPRLVGDDAPEDTFVAAPESDAAAKDASSPLSTSSGAIAAEAMPMMADEPLDFGPVADLDEIARRLAEVLDAPAGSTTSTPRPPAGPDTTERAACVATIRAVVEGNGGAILLSAFAIVGGDPVVAVAATYPDGDRRMDAATVADCTPLGARPL